MSPFFVVKRFVGFLSAVVDHHSLSLLTTLFVLVFIDLMVTCLCWVVEIGESSCEVTVIIRIVIYLLFRFVGLQVCMVGVTGSSYSTDYACFIAGC